MLPFPALNHAAIITEKDAVSRYRNFETSFSFSLLQSDDATTLCSTVSQQGVYVADTVDRCCANVERTERELLQPRPRPGGLVLLAGGLPLARFPSRFLRANTLRFSLSSGCFLPRFLCSFFGRVGYGTPITSRFLYRRKFCLLAWALRAFLLSSLRVLRFPRQRCPNFATAATLPREMISLCWGASPPVDAVGRLALLASASSRINRCHKGILIHVKTL